MNSLCAGDTRAGISSPMKCPRKTGAVPRFQCCLVVACVMAKGGLKTLTYGEWFPKGALWFSAWPAQTSQPVFLASQFPSCFAFPRIGFLTYISSGHRMISFLFIHLADRMAALKA